MYLLHHLFREYRWPSWRAQWEAVCAWWRWKARWERDRERWRVLYGAARHYKPVISVWEPELEPEVIAESERCESSEQPGTLGQSERVAKAGSGSHTKN